MSVQEMIEDARMLSLDERKQLIKALVDMITDEIPAKKSNIRQFRGIGEHSYTGVDATESVRKMRDEWEIYSGQ